MRIIFSTLRLKESLSTYKKGLSFLLVISYDILIFFNVPKSSRPINLLGFFDDIPFYTCCFLFYAISVFINTIIIIPISGQNCPCHILYRKRRYIYVCVCLFFPSCRFVFPQLLLRILTATITLPTSLFVVSITSA